MKSARLYFIAIVLSSALAHAQTTQVAPPNWALDRIDQHSGPLDNTYSYTTTGAGVNVYILDSGIRADHTEFAGRLTVDKDYVDGAGGSGSDCTGHGTAVAGIAAGTTYGVAKGAHIHVLRVIGCTDDSDMEQSRIAQALEWVRFNAVKPAVVNISANYYGEHGAFTTNLEQAVKDVLNAGIPIVVSTGNFAGPYPEEWLNRRLGGDCDTFFGCSMNDLFPLSLRNEPAQVPGVITVGAATYYNQGSYWDHRVQNTHWYADVYAPGWNLTTASIAGNTATQSFSYTSAAAPVVTGVVARHLQSHPAATPGQVRWWLIANATQGTLSHVPASESLLVYMAATE